MIRTERLLLRRAALSDIDAFHAIMTDKDVMRYWSNPPHEDRAQTEAFVKQLMQWTTPEVEEWVIEWDGRCIGKAGCWRWAEVGFLIHRDAWGNGYATEALQAVLPLCFAKFADAPALTAECDPRNARSVALLKRLGFRHLRTIEKDFLYGAAEWCDTSYFELPRVTGAT